jgi:catechol 2,3-dioxygenase-like lactoylglutathione lyase family enzyme
MTYAHLTLATQDVDATIDFLGKTFGWELIGRPENVEKPGAWLSMAENQQIHLLHIDGYEPSPFEGEFGRHFAIFHPKADYDALKQRLLDHGAEISEAIVPTSFPRFFARDPNGYYFEIVEEEAYAER